MRSSSPAAETRMPVRIGRVSSREAERATRAIVSTNAGAGTVDDLVAARLGQRREVLGAQRAEVEARRAGDDLDVLLGGAQLERDARRPGSWRTTSSEQPRRQHDGARALDLAPRAARAGRSPCRSPAARRPSPAAIWTPESACTALRVDATRATICSCARSSCVDVDSFTIGHLWMTVMKS